MTPPGSGFLKAYNYLYLPPIGYMPRQRTEDRGRRTRGRRSEVRSQRSEDGWAEGEVGVVSIAFPGEFFFCATWCKLVQVVALVRNGVAQPRFRRGNPPEIFLEWDLVRLGGNWWELVGISGNRRGWPRLGAEGPIFGTDPRALGKF